MDCSQEESTRKSKGSATTAGLLVVAFLIFLSCVVSSISAQERPGAANRKHVDPLGMTVRGVHALTAPTPDPRVSPTPQASYSPSPISTPVSTFSSY